MHRCFRVASGTDVSRVAICSAKYGYTMTLLPPGRTVPIDVPVHGSARSGNRLNIGTRASSGFNFTVLVFRKRV